MLGELIGTVLTSGSDGITADIYEFAQTCKEYSDYQDTYGGEINMSIVTEGMSAYLNVTFK